MQLNKSLILFQYILKPFSYGAFEDLRDEFNHKAGGVSSTGYTFWASALMGNADKLVDDRLVQEYDEAIQGYKKRLRDNRAEPFLTFKYYQWLSLLFTEHFFNLYYRPTNLVNELNAYLQEHPNLSAVEPYQAGC